MDEGEERNGNRVPADPPGAHGDQAVELAELQLVNRAAHHLIPALLGDPALANARIPTTPDRDERMYLSLNEIIRAMEIKQAAQDYRQGSHTLKPLSDFEYVQCALTTAGETMDQILHRMAMMRAFREEYKVKDTVEQGLDMINRLTLEQPGFLLSLEYLGSSKNYLTVYDWQEFNAAGVKTYEQRRTFMAATYYCFQCKACEFQATRIGSSVLVECMGVTTRNFDEEFLMKLIHEMYRWYPKNQKEFFLVNSPSIVNFIFNLWRKYMTTNQKQTTHMGHQIRGLEGNRIDHLYKTPTPEIARIRMLLLAKGMLELRYQHERDFRFSGF